VTIQGVLARGMPAELGRTQCPPGDAIARRVKAGKRAFQAAHIREDVLLRHKYVVHDDFAGNGRTQADLAVNRRRSQTLPAFFQNKATNVTLIVLRPDHKHIGDGAVGDPHFAARQAVAAIHRPRTGNHRARVGAVVRLGKTEAANPFARRQLGQVLLFLRFGTELIDRHHDQGRLHTHHRAVARVHPLHFAGNQPVADVIEATATVLLRDHRAQQTGLTHLTKNRRVGLLIAESLKHTRRQLVLSKLLGTVAHHALFFSELLIQQQWINPVEACLTRHERTLA